MSYVEVAAMEGPPAQGRAWVFPPRWGTVPRGDEAIARWARSHIVEEQRTARAVHLARRLLDPVDGGYTTGDQAQAILRRRNQASCSS